MNPAVLILASFPLYLLWRGKLLTFIKLASTSAASSSTGS